ncbi:hypothetical protein P3342_005268 [Pyrenophora teres f. teres]|nr:hypothetical protein P3342_005268 [Pyrenophora teres f. teres]
MDSIYTIRASPGEGLGCFATTCISPGTLILSEAPLFAVREPRTNSAVISAFADLDHLQQELYLTLYAQNTAAEGDARVIDIFNSNAWQTGSCTSICPLAARFNHSCVPNASFAWNSRTSQITVHAIVAIPAGEARGIWFICSCGACSSDVEASDVRRSRMVVLDARIRTGRRQLWRSPVPKAALELVKLLKEEGLVGEALGLAYHDATIGWKKYGRLDLALQTAVKELETAVICFGRDSPAVDASNASLSELKAEYAEQRRLRPVIDTELVEVMDENLVNDLHLV